MQKLICDYLSHKCKLHKNILKIFIVILRPTNTKNLEVWIICYNFAADLVRKGSNKLWHNVIRLTEKTV